MNNKNVFLKDLSDYLDIELSEYDCKRIGGYLDEYVAKLPKERKPPIMIMSAPKIVYKYVNQDKNHEIVNGRVVKIVEPNKIIELVEKFAGITKKAMMGKDRCSRITLGRHIAMWYINKLCHETYTQTGKMFNRDHTTVIYAANKVKDMLQTGHQQYVKIVDQINNELSIPLEKTA